MKCAAAAVFVALVSSFPGVSSAASGSNKPSNDPTVVPAYMADSKGRVIGPLVAPVSMSTLPAAQAALWRSPWGNIKVQFRASGPAATSEFSYLVGPSIYFASMNCTGPAYVFDGELWSFVPGFSRAFVADDAAGTQAAPEATIGTVYLVSNTAETVTPRSLRSPLGLSCDAMAGAAAQMFRLQAVGRFSDHFVAPYLVK